MLLKTWESVDKMVRKDVIKCGQFGGKPTERANCEIVVENINVVNATVPDLVQKYNSEILNGIHERSLIIGEANCEIDRQIERAIQMMMPFETSSVTLNVSLEGTNGRVIIKFEISLNEMQPHKPIWEWTPEEKYLIASEYKEIGVQLFKDGRYIDAFHRFSKACKILITLEPICDLELDEKLVIDINDLRLILYNNMAGCQLNRKNYEYTISLCNKILEKECYNVKALYRRGVAHGRLKDLEKAVDDLKNAIALEPHNVAVKEQFVAYNVRLQDANKKCDDMVRRMFKT